MSMTVAMNEAGWGEIPAEVRRRFQLKGRTSIEMEVSSDGITLRPEQTSGTAKPPPARRHSAVAQTARAAPGTTRLVRRGKLPSPPAFPRAWISPRPLRQSAKSAKQNSPGLSCAGYLERNLERMEYAFVREEGLPIGSGIIEAACKCAVKVRVCGSGLRWERPALPGVLTLRSLDSGSDRRDQFGKRCATFGY